MTAGVYDRTVVVMGTFVTISVVDHGEHADAITARAEAVGRAFGWFHAIETCCSRFDPTSELMQLTAQAGAAVPASPILFEAVRFALAVAAETGGAFDPTVGHRMESAGFNRELRSGNTIRTSIESGRAATWRDVVVDVAQGTITLLQPLVLDLGAVAKGLAIDTAARELAPFRNFAIDAGGDLYLSGRNPAGEPWAVGIRHPRQDGLLDTIRVTDRAVCTSGDYERTSPTAGGGHHILDPRTGVPADTVASTTVVAPTAMLADAVATAAFVLGPAEGLRLFDRLGVDGLIVSPALERHATRGMSRDYALGKQTAETGRAVSALRPHAEGPAPDHPRRADPHRVVRGGRRPGRPRSD